LAENKQPKIIVYIFAQFYLLFFSMKHVHMKPQTEISVKGIIGFFVKKVTPFGTGAKVDCPKEFL